MNNYPELDVNSSMEEIISDTDNINDDASMGEGSGEGEEETTMSQSEQSEPQQDLDITIVQDDEHPTNYDGVVDTDEHMHDDYVSAVSLKRNLSETFEKHAKEVEMKQAKKKRESSDSRNNLDATSLSSSNNPTDNSKRSRPAAVSSVNVAGVRAKIKAFEQKNAIIKPKDYTVKSNSNSNKVRFDTTKNTTRPPTAPVPGKIHSHVNDTTKKQQNPTGSSLLSVFLRIRPLSVSTEAINKDQTACHNTVEVLPPSSTKNNDGSDDITTAPTTTIRTYPPLQSNASKVVRGQHQLHSSSHNTDLIFHARNKTATSTDQAVKGVKEFNFNRVFDQDSTQEEIFQYVALPLVDGLFPKDDVKIVGDKVVGKSALLFSYGITNAGKTYTIMGKDDNDHKKGTDMSSMVQLDEAHGIIPRTIDHMLTKIRSVENDQIKYQLNVSFLEIYNEQIYDLLPNKNEKELSIENGSSKRSLHSGPGVLPFDQNSLRIRESRNGNIHVRGLTKHHVTSLGRGLDLVKKAKSRRHTSSNKINSDSSRSHSICQFELLAIPTVLNQMIDVADNDSTRTSSSAGYSSDDDSTAQTCSKSRKKGVTFWIVDLAGSERSKRTGTFGRSTRQKEAALINSSLMKLMRCLQTLRHNHSTNGMSVVPFRESKLTHLFMGHLTGAAASRTGMVVNINPSIADFDETQHVLSYAVSAKSIRISESDYNKKRRAIQIAGNASAHISLASSTNEGKKQGLEKSPPRKIARLVKKLSPRAALARMKEQKQEKNKRKLQNDGQDIKRASSKSKIGQVDRKTGGGGSGHMGIFGKNKQLESEIEELRKALSESQSEVERYQKETITLRGKLVRCEADIRKEIFEETEQYHQCIHQQHNEIVNRLKQQLAAASQAPSMSTRKVQRNKADALVSELMEQVDECEEEMKRMSEKHKQEIMEINDTFNEMLTKKDDEMTKLKLEIEEKSGLLEEVKDENSYEEDTDEYVSSESPSSIEEEEASLHNKENSSIGHQTGPSPRLRRLPRGRCSEVACANISPPKDEQLSSKKKKKGLSKIRSPFSSKNNKVNISNNDNDFSKKANSLEPNSGTKDIVYPSSQPELDEVTGLYQRPRGRAPIGRAWDDKAGGWRRFGQV